jgi:hypothetical protein
MLSKYSRPAQQEGATAGGGQGSPKPGVHHNAAQSRKYYGASTASFEQTLSLVLLLAIIGDHLLTEMWCKNWVLRPELDLLLGMFIAS